MKLPRNLSGFKLIKVLTKNYGWKTHNQSGSHVTLKKEGEKNILTVPLHNNLDPGTTLSILRKASVEKDDFLQNL